MWRLTSPHCYRYNSHRLPQHHNICWHHKTTVNTVQEPRVYTAQSPNTMPHPRCAPRVHRPAPVTPSYHPCALLHHNCMNLCSTSHITANIVYRTTMQYMPAKTILKNYSRRLRVPAPWTPLKYLLETGLTVTIHFHLPSSHIALITPKMQTPRNTIIIIIYSQHKTEVKHLHWRATHTLLRQSSPDTHNHAASIPYNTFTAAHLPTYSHSHHNIRL